MATEIQVSCECFESDKLIFHWKRFLEERLDLVTTMVKKKKTTKNWYRYTSVLASQLSSNLLYAYCQVTNVKFFLCPRCENTCSPSFVLSHCLADFMTGRKFRTYGITDEFSWSLIVGLCGKRRELITYTIKALQYVCRVVDFPSSCTEVVFLILEDG